MKMKNFNYYEFLITYENEIPQILPFIYLFIFFDSFANIVLPPRKVLLIFS